MHYPQGKGTGSKNSRKLLPRSDSESRTPAWSQTDSRWRFASEAERPEANKMAALDEYAAHSIKAQASPKEIFFSQDFFSRSCRRCDTESATERLTEEL